MKRKARRFGKGFNVVLGNKHSQAAQMVLERANPRAMRKTGTLEPISGSLW